MDEGGEGKLTFSLGQDDAVRIIIDEDQSDPEAAKAVGYVALQTLTNVVRTMNERSRADG